MKFIEVQPKTETPEQIADDLAYRIVEEMGLGLTFRSCSCGQLPCARLRPLTDALRTVKQSERERCAKIAESHRDAAYRLEEVTTERRDRVIAASRASIARSIATTIREGK